MGPLGVHLAREKAIPGPNSIANWCLGDCIAVDAAEDQSLETQAARPTVILCGGFQKRLLGRQRWRNTRGWSSISDVACAVSICRSSPALVMS